MRLKIGGTMKADNKTSNTVLIYLRRRLRAVLFGVLLVPSLHGEAVATGGIDDPEFQAALRLWLDDNEKDALPELARLTQRGNQAALFLLAMIDKTVELQGPWLGLLPREERSKLMRAPGGFSGLSWLNFQADSVFARTWLDVWRATSTVQSALDFSAIGEPRAARRSLLFLEARQGTGFAEVRDHPGYPDEMRYLVWRQWRFEGGHEKEISQELSKLPPGDGQREMMGQRIARAELENWLMTAPPARQLSTLCRSVCPGAPGSCAWAAFRALGGYSRMMSLGSPVASVVSDDDFVMSRRAHMTVIRAVVFAEQLNEFRIERIRALDACFADVVADEGQNF